MTIDTSKNDVENRSLRSEKKSFFEFRSHPRMEMKKLKATIKKRGLLSKHISIEVIDLSKGGIGVECRSRIEVGEKVDIKLGSKKFTGSVVYLKQFLGVRNFKLGVQFDEELSISDMFYVGAPAEIAFS
ncbi:PilZ domain-containing protein [Vibrio sp. ZSDE26]|uniref:PilZ domain-containing protein n=1 Tax=Vibrio amylolyticus TaxID=2847292 RepID=A0A9X1XUE5_9VIBR|nr:PilZ domain-containing protein [Vibrio amylolyticus]MCK6265779.1 PilZ domain-containing protein [Vibrio amylolyticus]